MPTGAVMKEFWPPRPTTMHFLLQEFKEFYEGKLGEVDRLKENEEISREKRLEKKMEILRDFVNDLGEQNLNLIETAKELQEAAEQRVELLEKLLQKTTVGAKEYVKQLMVYQNEIHRVSQEKEKLNSLIQHFQTKQEIYVEEKKNLLTENVALVNNLMLLLQLINSVRATGLWDHLFIEIDPLMHNINDRLEAVEKYLSNRWNSVDETGSTNKENSVFYDEPALSHSFSLGSPCLSSSCHSQEDRSVVSGQMTEKDVTIKRLRFDLDCTIKARNDMHFKMLEKDRTIASLQSEITELQHSLSLEEAKRSGFEHALKNREDQQRLTNVERCYFDELVRQLRKHHEKNFDDDSSGFMWNDNNNINIFEILSDHKDEQLKNRKSNAATQTDMTQSKLHVWQKEMNTLQSTVIGLKVALTHIYNHHGRNDQSELKNFENCCDDELTKTLKSACELLSDADAKVFNNSSVQENSQKRGSAFFGSKWNWATHVSQEKIKSPPNHSDDCVLPLAHVENETSPNGIQENKNDIAEKIPCVNSSDIKNECSNMDSEIFMKMEKKIQEWKEKCARLEQDRIVLEQEHDNFKDETFRLKEDLRLLEAAAQETRVVLTREIAERFDTIKALRQEMAEQAEQHKESVQQLVLKAEVMRGLRKELRQLQTKISEDETLIEKLTKEKTECEEKLKESMMEIENQKITIRNLQEALVQTKRSPDAVISGNSVITNGSSVQSVKSRSSSSRDIFDI